jgi:soluble lytic murein transglycosylase
MTHEGSRRRAHNPSVGAALSFLAFAALWAPPAQATEIDEQRALFITAHEAAERGDFSVVDNLPATERQLLEQYVLWPDLKATWLRASLGSVDRAEVDAFLRRFGTLRPARELRYRFALHLAKSGDLAAYHGLYQQYYQGQGIARLDCLALQAELADERLARVDGHALELWLVGHSQVEECDPVFEYLEENARLGPLEYRERYTLAIDAREFMLARWLAKKIDAAHLDEATAWVRAQDDPETFLRSYRKLANTASTREQLAYAAERLTYRDPELASKLWKKAVRLSGFSEEQKLRTARHIALWTARDRLPGAYRRLTRLPTAAQNDEVLRWRARTSLREGNWRNLLRDLAAMTTTERDADQWRYWHGVALQQTGHAEDARSIFETLSRERSYYGFLSADELGVGYALEPSAMAIDEAALDALADHPGLVRARELFLVGQEGRGRSEWDAVVAGLPEAEKQQAAILADRWGWHSRAIATVAKIGAYDDLAIRYPLPYQHHFEMFATAASIATTWAYGIARSESLFMRDVRSNAGAIGLMQLMPATGREVADRLQLPYVGLATLTDPEHNIRLGTSYLGQMAERYGGNLVPATAAYNAGPHRVDSWLPQSAAEDARIWIENIPFNETRKYVKRVFAAQTIFHWRMTGEVRRLSDELRRVSPPPTLTKLASR